MPLFAVTYRYVPDSAEVARLRPARMEYFRRLEAQGALVASGQLIGSELGDGMLVVRAESAGSVAEVLEGDPFAVADLVVERTVSEWNVTVGTALQG